MYFFTKLMSCDEVYYCRRAQYYITVSWRPVPNWLWDTFTDIFHVELFCSSDCCTLAWIAAGIQLCVQVAGNRNWKVAGLNSMQGGYFAIQPPILGAIKSRRLVHMGLSPSFNRPPPLVDGGFGPPGISRCACTLVLTPRVIGKIKGKINENLDEKKFTTRSAFTLV